MNTINKYAATAKRKTLVLFDIGAVLLKLEYGSFYNEASKLSKHLNPEKFKEAYLSSNLEGLSVCGSISVREYLDGLSDIISPGEKISDDELKRLVSHCWNGPIREVIDIKRRAYGTGYSVGLFSNMSELALEILSEKHPEIFDVHDLKFPVVYSFRVGDMKPNDAMYEEIKGYDNVIFIDDKESYLKTGIDKFGWMGILLTPYADKDELLRAVHTDKTRPSKNFRIANSSGELIDALAEFGVYL